MDRAQARDQLVLTMLVSKELAARIRAVVDHSQFNGLAPLVMLVADHDLRRPHAPMLGAERRASITEHVRDLLSASMWHLRGGQRPHARRTDPRWPYAPEAIAALDSFADRLPHDGPIEPYLRALDPDATSEPKVPPQRRASRGEQT